MTTTNAAQRDQPCFFLSTWHGPGCAKRNPT